jgi:hypothetical protein
VSRFSVVALNVPSAMEDMLGLRPKNLRMHLATVAHLARGYWITIAKEELVSSERDYTGAISPAIIGDEHDLQAFVSLSGRLPNMVEWGWDPHDLHQTILKDGRAFVIIPFRYGRSTSSNRNMRTFGKAYASRYGLAAAMGFGIRIRNRASRLRATTLSVDGKVRWGTSLREELSGQKLRSWHSAPIYAGTYKLASPYAKMMGTKYVTFRTISLNPSSRGAMGWRHPGIRARHFVERTQAYVERIAPSVFGLGGESDAAGA